MELEQPERRVLVVGLDGATLDLVDPWVRAGKLPVLAGLMQSGAWARLRSVLPVLSPSAWASFLTGVNPGRHGLYDFARRVPGTYQLGLAHLGHNRSVPLWRIANAQGRRAIILNVPTTYPPEPLDGVMASGLGAPAFKPFAYPAAIGAELERRGYRVDFDVPLRPGREASYLEGYREHARRQAGAVAWLMREQPWDILVYVLRGTDEVAHRFWKHMDTAHPAHDKERDEPWRDALLEHYQECDRLTGELIAAAGPDVTTLVMSDHGMGPLYKDVYLNEWLRQQGYLAVRERQPIRQAALARMGVTRTRVSATLRGMRLGWLERAIKDRLGARIRVLPRDRVRELEEAVDWGHTRAYSFGYHGQIYLNLKGREPEGIVQPGAEADALRREIMQKLGELTDPADGQAVVSAMYRAEDLYSGPNVAYAPDIIVLMRDLAYITRRGYEIGDQPGVLFGPPAMGESASHRLNGLLVAAGPGIVQHGGSKNDISIMDVMPTILHIMGCEVPHGLDGKVQSDWLDDDARRRPVKFTEGAGTASAAATDFTEEEEAEVVERLKDLGYLG